MLAWSVVLRTSGPITGLQRLVDGSTLVWSLGPWPHFSICSVAHKSPCLRLYTVQASRDALSVMDDENKYFLLREGYKCIQT